MGFNLHKLNKKKNIFIIFEFFLFKLPSMKTFFFFVNAVKRIARSANDRYYIEYIFGCVSAGGHGHRHHYDAATTML